MANLFANQHTTRDITGAGFGEFWKEKGEKKSWPSYNHEPKLIIYFPKPKLFPKGKKSYKIMWFRKSQNESVVKLGLFFLRY